MSSTADHVLIPRKPLAKQVLFRFCLAVLYMYSWQRTYVTFSGEILIWELPSYYQHDNAALEPAM